MKKTFRTSVLKGFSLTGLASLLAAGLFSSCNDTGTSPYAPVIQYKSTAISAVKNTKIAPDSVTLTGGAVSGYSVSPALPTGLALDGVTGVISGTPTQAT